MADDNLKKSGQTAEVSGQYEVVGPRGGKVKGQEITAVKGKKLPPTPEPGQKLKLRFG